ncbi:hypothetical protein [Staphylococcus auricularis]|uniref:hypothetical protein n=1 Tax=Staphylococcus auricularis TaxID=29379 RepID=UPI00242A9969|nr:hypothetical protein [Staphylococcus auricularis]
MLTKHWKLIITASVIVNLLSIKGFFMALGSLYFLLIFKVIDMQMNLSKGLVDDVDPMVYVRSNTRGVIIAVICFILATVIFMFGLDDFYNSLPGVLGVLVDLNPLLLIIGTVLFIFSAIAVIQVLHQKYDHRTEV